MKGDSEEMLNAANKLHPNLQFTLEKATEKGRLDFVDTNVNVDTRKNVISGWYQKSIDTWKKLNIRSCAPLNNKKNIEEGAPHQFFKSTSTWNKFDEAMNINRKQWVDNQYPEDLTDKIVSSTLDRLIKGKANKSPCKDLPHGSIDNTGIPPTMVVLYQCNGSVIFANKVRNIIKAAITYHPLSLFFFT